MFMQVDSSLSKLAECHELASTEKLYEIYTRQVLANMESSYMHWTQHSVERYVFDALLMESGLCSVMQSMCHVYLL